MTSAYDLYQQGWSHLRDGMPAQATVALEKAKRLEPDKASIREALGIAYFRISRWAEAEAEFRKVLELAPADDYAHYALGRALRNQGTARRGCHAPQARPVAASAPLRRAGPRRRSGLEVGDERRVAAKAPGDRSVEGEAVRLRRLVVERGGVAVADLEQPVGDRVHDELEVAVRLLGLVPP